MGRNHDLKAPSCVRPMQGKSTTEDYRSEKIMIPVTQPNQGDFKKTENSHDHMTHSLP